MSARPYFLLLENPFESPPPARFIFIPPLSISLSLSQKAFLCPPCLGIILLFQYHSSSVDPPFFFVFSILSLCVSLLSLWCHLCIWNSQNSLNKCLALILSTIMEDWRHLSRGYEIVPPPLPTQRDNPSRDRLKSGIIERTENNVSSVSYQAELITAFPGPSRIQCLA